MVRPPGVAFPSTRRQDRSIHRRTVPTLDCPSFPQRCFHFQQMGDHSGPLGGIIKATLRNEKVTRLDIQRRQLRDALQVNDVLLDSVAAELEAIQALKQQWIYRQTQAEVERKTLMTRESRARGDMEAAARTWFEETLQIDFLPPLRKLRTVPVQPAHRRKPAGM